MLNKGPAATPAGVVLCDAVVIHTASESRIYYNRSITFRDTAKVRVSAGLRCIIACDAVASMGIPNTWAELREDGNIGVIFSAGDCAYDVYPKGYFKAQN